MKLLIKKINSNATIPIYQSEGAAGFDLYAIEDAFIKAKQYCLIGTGLALQIPNGFEVQIRPRSGLALKYGITVLNAPGTIDSDYRDELKIILINHSQKDYQIKAGDRIAQGVLAATVKADFKLVESLDKTARKGGFGSTGK